MARPPASEAADPEQDDSEIAISTTEIAAAPIGLSLSMFLKMKMDATCVWNGMFPEIRTIEPNSPIARAKASAAPERIAGTRFGRMTGGTRPGSRRRG